MSPKERHSKFRARNRNSSSAGWGYSPSENTCVLMDSSLSLDTQVLVVVRSSLAQLKIVHQLHSFFESSDPAMVTSAFLISQLDYCNMFFMGLPLESVQNVQWAQNTTAILLTGGGYRKHVTPLLQRFHCSISGHISSYWF